MDELPLKDLEPKGEKLTQLHEDLSAATRAGIKIPQELDDAILKRAREVFDPTPPKQLRLGKPAAWIAVAASLTLIIWISDVIRSAVTTSKQEATAAVIPGDIDRNGKVDILDAFELARVLDKSTTGSPVASSHINDLNADGTVDSLDVNAIAMKAVALPQGGAS